MQLQHKERDTVIIFPIYRSRAWRAIETYCLRAAGNERASLNRALNHIRAQFSNVQREIIEGEIEWIAAYTRHRVQEQRRRCGLIAEQPTDADDAIEMPPGPKPAA